AYALDDIPPHPDSSNAAQRKQFASPHRQSVILEGPAHPAVPGAPLFHAVGGTCGKPSRPESRPIMPEESAAATATPGTPAAPPVATIATLGQHEGQSVTLRGWLYNLRESGKLLFPIFRDGTGTVQGVAHVKSVSPEVFEALKGLTQESSVIVTGKVRADKRAPGGFELDVEDVNVVQRVPESDPYPITLKEHGVEFLMEHRHLWVRSPRQSAILRIRAEIMRAAAEYFEKNGFIRTDPQSSRRRRAKALPRCSRWIILATRRT